MSDKPHGPVSERFMRHHYGASGYPTFEQALDNLEKAHCDCKPGVRCAIHARVKQLRELAAQLMEAAVIVP